MEQSDLYAEDRLPAVMPARELSDEVRASLDAVREAQTAARLRAHRQTVRTRIWSVTVIGAVAVVAFVVGPRVARGRYARTQAAKTATASTATSASVASASVASRPVAAVTAPTVAEPSEVLAKEQPVVPAQQKASDAASDQGCDTGLIHRAPWRLSASACARAFESDTTNATLALAIAHAEHAHGTRASAAGWAKRALALDPNAAEAYVLIARAELKDGHTEEARTAYRRYLELAPRGWHQTEARAAVRADR